MSDPTPPPMDLEAEEIVVGMSIMLGGAPIDEIVTDHGLQHDDFASDSLGLLWRAMTAMRAAGRSIDALLLAKFLADKGLLEQVTTRYGGTILTGRAAVDSIALAAGPSGPNDYAERIVRMARLRRRQHTHLTALSAIDQRNEEALAAAEALLLNDDRDLATERMLELEQQHEAFQEHMAGGDHQAVPTPWPSLNERLNAGGLVLGSTTVLTGITSMGKSLVCDAILDHAVTLGYRAALWMNEMEPWERINRRLNRQTGVPLGLLDKRAPLATTQQRLIDETLAAPTWGIQPCAGWKHPRIAASIIRYCPQLAVVDLATQIPGLRDTSDWDDMVRTLVNTARQAHTALVLVAQLNRSAVQVVPGMPVRKPPSMHALRNTGAWEQDCANALIVHRDERAVLDEHGDATGELEQLDTGLFKLDKARGGQPGSVLLDFDRQRLRWLDQAERKQKVSEARSWYEASDHSDDPLLGAA